MPAVKSFFFGGGTLPHAASGASSLFFYPFPPFLAELKYGRVHQFFPKKRLNALRSSPGYGSRVSSERHCQIQRGNQEREGKMAIFSSVKSLRNEVWRQLLSEGFFHPIHQLPPPFSSLRLNDASTYADSDGHVRLEWEGAIHHRASLSPFPSQFPRFPLSIPCARILQHCCVQEE